MRYYDSSPGRWTQQDPVAGSLGDLNSGNRYTYVEDNPVNLVDPSGKDDCFTQIVEYSLGELGSVLVAVGANLTLLEAVAAGASLTIPGFFFFGAIIPGSAAALGLASAIIAYMNGG